MARKTRNKFVRRGEVLEILIQDYAFGGKGIGRITGEHGEFVIFVPNTLPGQHVKAQVKKVSRTYAECTLLEVLKPSKDEIEVPYQEIPGAPYIKLPIAKQHAYKKQSTLELFRRIGKVKDIETVFDEFVCSPGTFHYRNKMEYAFSAIGYDHKLKTDVDEFTLGFKKRGTWWCGDDLKKDSGLFDQEVEDKLKLIKNYCKETGLAPWHAPKKQGFFRYFVVRKSIKTNQLLFNLVTTSDGLKQFDLPEFADFLVSHFADRVAGLIHTTNDEIGDRTIAATGDGQLVYGEDKVVEELPGLHFEISMKSFFQTNPQSAEKLYDPPEVGSCRRNPSKIRQKWVRAAETLQKSARSGFVPQEPFKSSSEVGSCRRNPSKIRQKWVRAAETLQKSARSGFVPQEPFKNPPEVGSCRRNPSKIRQKWVRAAGTLQKSARSGFVPQEPFKNPPEVGSCRRNLSKVRLRWVRAAGTLQKSARSGFVPQRPFKSPPEVGSRRRDPSKVRQKWVRAAETLQKSARSGFVPQRPFKNPPEVGSCRRNLSKVRLRWVRAAGTLQKSARSGFVPQRPFKNPPEVGSCRRNPSKIRQKWVRAAETLQKSARSGFVPQRPFKSPPEVGSCRRNLSKIRQKWVRAAGTFQKFV